MNIDSTEKISKIAVICLKLRTYIGFNNWEKDNLQDIVISFSFKYNVYEAVKKDDVAFGINYKSITKDIIGLIENKHFNLLETVAEIIYATIKKIPEALEVDVKVEKPNALRFCDNVIVQISGKDRFNVALIAIGSNINPEQNTDKAIAELENIGSITKKTEFLVTKPLKMTDQPNFWNGAVLLNTKLDYGELNKTLKVIEHRLGRERTENKNAPRTIDLDIIAFNSTLVDKEAFEFPFLVKFIHQLQPEMAITANS